MSKIKKKLICIGGPTASGKTDLSIALAQRLNTSIISADSRQIYKYFDIGTAKPTLEERQSVTHHLMDQIDPNKKFSAGDFEREALKLLECIFDERDHAIVVGGTGLFFNALIDGLDDFPEVSDEIRNELNSNLQKNGIGFLQEMLKKVDPHYYTMVDIHNPTRLIRALSVCQVANAPYSSFLKQKKVDRGFESYCFTLDPERDRLYNNINERVNIMIEKGLQKEVENLLQYRDCDAFNTVGYKEWLDFFEGKQSFDRTIELIKQNSRRYAKRQFTWFKNQGNWSPINKTVMLSKNTVQIGKVEDYIISLVN